MKPLFLLFAVLLFALPSFSAERVCKARRGHEGHESFCSGLSSFACNAHNSLCRWIEGWDD